MQPVIEKGISSDAKSSPNSEEESLFPISMPNDSTRSAGNVADDDTPEVSMPNDHSTKLMVDMADGSTKGSSEEDDGPKKKCELPPRIVQIYTTADWWTMWIGVICFFVAVAIVYSVPFELGSLRARHVVPQPMKWVKNPIDAWDLYGLIGSFIMICLFCLLYLLSLYFMGKFDKNPALLYTRGFFAVSAVAALAFWIGNQKNLRASGFGYAIWSLVFGMLIGNSPLVHDDRLKATKIVAKDGEFFIKCSLVLLAVEFKVLGQLGMPAIVVAWGSSPVALVMSYLIGTRLLKASPGPTLLVSVGATWCGASAISAVASVIDSPTTDVTLSIGIVAAATAIFTFAQPYFAVAVGMDEMVAGAWIGASVDQTGNVIASAAIISDEAAEIAGIVKIILNSALGILASIIAVWWQSRAVIASDESDGQGGAGRKGFSFLYLWDKFPKFVLGYLFCSCILSILVKDGTATGDALPRAVQSMSKWWFSIAFVGIGISTNFKELYRAGRDSGVIQLYFIANALDMALAYLLAWLMF